MIIEEEKEAPKKKEEQKPLSGMEMEMEFLALANKLPPKKRGRKKKASVKKASVSKSLLYGKETPKPIAFRTRTRTNAKKL